MGEKLMRRWKIMKHEVKKILFDAIMNVIDNSPTLKKNSEKLGGGMSSDIQLNVTQDEFNIWTGYVFSTLNILSQHIEDHVCSTAKNQIDNIIASPNTTMLARKILEIDKILLSLARNIVDR